MSVEELFLTGEIPHEFKDQLGAIGSWFVASECFLQDEIWVEFTWGWEGNKIFVEFPEEVMVFVFKFSLEGEFEDELIQECTDVKLDIQYSISIFLIFFLQNNFQKIIVLGKEKVFQDIFELTFSHFFFLLVIENCVLSHHFPALKLELHQLAINSLQRRDTYI